VPTSFATLCANDVRTDIDAFLNVLGVADHVHVEDAVLVELVNDGFGWDPDSGDEEFGARIDNDID